jgi:hypothetical protein
MMSIKYTMLCGAQFARQYPCSISQVGIIASYSMLFLYLASLNRPILHHSQSRRRYLHPFHISLDLNHLYLSLSYLMSLQKSGACSPILATTVAKPLISLLHSMMVAWSMLSLLPTLMMPFTSPQTPLQSTPLYRRLDF